jgi:LPXTG-motif cell wall-anchored protein
VLLEIICEFKKRIKLFLIPLVVSLFVFITTGSSDEAFSWLGALSMTIVVYIFYKLKQKVDETEG